MLKIGALIALLDRKGLLSKAEVLAEIKSLQRQLAERTGDLPEQQEPFPQPYLNVQAENAIIDLEVFNATGLTAHQATRQTVPIMLMPAEHENWGDALPFNLT